MIVGSRTPEPPPPPPKVYYIEVSREEAYELVRTLCKDRVDGIGWKVAQLLSNELASGR